MRPYIVIVLLSFFSGFVMNNYVTKISYAEYKDILGALLNISSIVFAIIGVWIAIIYPGAIGKAFQPNLTSKDVENLNSDSTYLSELVETVLVSAFVLMMVLLIQFFVPILKVSIPNSYLSIVKIIGFFVISFLTFLQLYAVNRVIIQNYHFLFQLRSSNVKAKSKHYFGRR